MPGFYFFYFTIKKINNILNIKFVHSHFLYRNIIYRCRDRKLHRFSYLVGGPVTCGSLNAQVGVALGHLSFLYILSTSAVRPLPSGRCSSIVPY